MADARRINLLTTDEAARYLRASASWLAKERASGRGPVVTRLGKRALYTVADLDAYLVECRRNPGEECRSSETPAAKMSGGAGSGSTAGSSIAQRAKQIAAELKPPSAASAPKKRLASPALALVTAKQSP